VGLLEPRLHDRREEQAFDAHGELQIVQAPSTGFAGAGGFTLTVRK